MTSPAKFTDMGANSSYPDKTGQSGSRFSTLYRGLSFHFSEGDVATREKKKKLSKLQTLRKKLTRVRRHSRSFDYAKAIRDYTSNWTIRELSDLVDEYEASLNLKEITLLANLARPTANSLKQDLSHLYHSKFGSDLELIYRGTSFPVHRAILCSRCPYFRDLLQKYPKYGAQVPVEIKSHGVDTSLFSALLHYLYTGEFLLQDSQYEDLDTCILVHLRREFGTPNLLEYDLRNLLDSDDYCDAVLVFALDSDCHELLSGSCDTYGACAFSSSSKLELSCHKAILAARSNFFRNLLVRRGMHSLGKECSERANQKCERIVLDETVIPRKYARVLLQAIYLDTVDLSCVIRNSVSTSSLSEVQAIVTGKGHLTHAEEAIEIHEIGQFLDLPILSQGSEDIIVDTLGMDNLVPILLWSSQPLGSAWVYRQALHYLREDFLQIAHSPTILDLPKKYLIDAISSDFLQASEADVLCAVLKWGEHQLVKRMEEREPNLLNHTTHSVSKKGIKKRDLSDVELRDILSDLLVYVRADHIIPPNHEVLTNAIKRGLISTPPSHMMGDEPGHQSRASAWIRGRNRGTFLKPRLFQPHYDETKALLDEQLSQIQGNEEVQLRTVHMSNIPDTLYMVEGDTLGLQYFPGHLPSAATVDIIGGTILAGALTFSPRKCCQVIVATAVLHNICEERGIPPPPGERMNDEDIQRENVNRGHLPRRAEDEDGERARAAVIRENFWA
ncbi:BTB/POZ domain-containing protein 7-like isoform X2 [Lineus longissimus]|uniref:BTB/POZ domain-containing protein 7-like isoform X2 n=1 Tax=Lineus longissimus TaxID=88925 RepID=UPI00315DB409